MGTGTQTLTKARATALDKKIRAEAGKARNAVEQVSLLLKEARDGNVHTTLGFKSWPAYVKDVLAGSVTGVSVQERRVLVALMTGEGMSQNAIAEALGVSQRSVRRDQNAGTEVPESVNGRRNAPPDKPVSSGNVENPKSEAPAKTVGLDGKTYTKTAKPAAKPTKEQQAETASKIRKELADAGVVPKPPAEPKDKSALEIMVEVGIEAAERLDELKIILEVATELEERVQEVVECQDHRGEEEQELIKQISAKLIDITCSLAPLVPQESESKS